MGGYHSPLHHFGDISSRQELLLLGTTPGLGAPTSRSDVPGPAWEAWHLALLAAGRATKDHTCQRPPPPAGCSAVGL